MNASVQLPQAMISAAVPQRPLVAQLDVQTAENMYSLWKSVFEHTRPIEVADAAVSLAMTSARALQSDSDARNHAQEELPLNSHGNRDVLDRLDAKEGGALPIQTDAATHTMLGARKPTSTTDQLSLTEQRSSNVTANAVLLHHKLLSDASIADRIARRDSCASQPTNDAAMQNAVAQSVASEFAVAESIQVTVQGAVVAIVVRDAGLAERDALRSAFETARSLTGQSSALQKLVLNGRILYEQQIDSNPSAISRWQPSTALVFVC